MSLRVVGAGLGRTGTMSLKVALEKLLGAPCYHMAEVFEHPEHVADWHRAALGTMPDWQRLFTGYAAAVDWPVAAFWRPISEAFPDAVILLSTRDAQSWWESAGTTIFPTALRASGPWRDMFDAAMASTFTTDLGNRDVCIAAYERHVADVRATADPRRLLEWSPKDGWEPLCRVLGVPVPAEPFPRVNTKEDFLTNLAHRVP